MSWKEELVRDSGYQLLRQFYKRSGRYIWAQSGGAWDTKLLWATCCLAFFGFLRAGEFTTPSVRQFDPAVNLYVSNVAVDNSQSPTVLQLTLKQLKTDLFCKGVQLLIGKTGTNLCPVAAVLDYLQVRGTGKEGLSLSIQGWNIPDMSTID